MRKFIAIGIALIMIFAMSAVCFADGEVSEATTSTYVSYEVPANWEIRIPSHVDLTDGVSMAQIGVNYVHAKSGKTVYVDIDEEMSGYDTETGTVKMTTADGAHSIDLQIYNDTGFFSKAAGSHCAAFEPCETEDIISPFNVYFSPIVPAAAHADDYSGVIYFSIYCE